MALSPQDQQTLQAFFEFCKTHQYDNIGYPTAADFNYQELEKFWQFSFNNCGDWAETSNYRLNTFQFEKEVMAYFADKFNIPFSESWGYVTNGGTEGNMYSCYLARELFPNGILYFSEDTHYSVAKIVRLLRIEHRVVKSLPNGEMDYDDLQQHIESNGRANPIVFANIGTTLYGAIDDLGKIKEVLGNAGFRREEYYLHADAAFHGMILPFVDAPQQFSFSDDIDSISVSGHKMIGAPIPCGIVLTKKTYVDNISVAVDYIAAIDKTITGSRNGLTPLMMWHAIKSSTEQEKELRVKRCLRLAEYAVEKLKSKGVPAWLNPNSVIVVFPTPTEAVWRKYGLANSAKHAHLIITGHMIENTALLDQLIDDVAEDRNEMVVNYNEI
ncbi:histidine decarboxylase [Vibrio nigripulchritudo]|uniref:histidine decarboxylase n=1 Tax=Vibrio nigripulchritudo TaxID=28173 RepID=UPI00190C21CF|nr:histidine decarboxylase [Vibrio nigripulchritudo]BCL68620.1 histidine decarboxylase [Vibrio nigripulchritudo]BDU36109.1 histidine decarboxylase [Vibrio nigripulchritudo]BDU41765.1 histidine decarboxylase [Vibrio nigripulchritudo]